MTRKTALVKLSFSTNYYRSKRKRVFYFVKNVVGQKRKHMRQMFRHVNVSHSLILKCHWNSAELQ